MRLKLVTYARRGDAQSSQHFSPLVDEVDASREQFTLTSDCATWKEISAEDAIHKAHGDQAGTQQAAASKQHTTKARQNRQKQMSNNK